VKTKKLQKTEKKTSRKDHRRLRWFPGLRRVTLAKKKKFLSGPLATLPEIYTVGGPSPPLAGGVKKYALTRGGTQQKGTGSEKKKKRKTQKAEVKPT